MSCQLCHVTQYFDVFYCQFSAALRKSNFSNRYANTWKYDEGVKRPQKAESSEEQTDDAKPSEESKDKVTTESKLPTLVIMPI